MTMLVETTEAARTETAFEDGAPVESLPEVVGSSEATSRVRLQIERIGPHFRTVLIHGEIGTGKRLVAQALHARGAGPGENFIPCYAAALSELASSNQEPQRGTPWLWLAEDQAATVFLDGVESLSLQAQARLLEILSTGKGSRHRMRLIASAGNDLRRQLATGRFRADLYHRLARIEITLEPLRQRQADLPELTQHFLRRFCLLYGKEIDRVAEDAVKRMQQYHWPGNVRELENMMRNAVLACGGEALETHHLAPMLQERAVALEASIFSPKPSAPGDIESLQQVVDRHVLHVLELCGGNKVRAAEMLGISRSTLYRMLESVTNGTAF